MRRYKNNCNLKYSKTVLLEFKIKIKVEYFWGKISSWLRDNVSVRVHEIVGASVWLTTITVKNKHANGKKLKKNLSNQILNLEDGGE